MLGLALLNKQEYAKGIRELEKVCRHCRPVLCVSCTFIS